MNREAIYLEPAEEIMNAGCMIGDPLSRILPFNHNSFLKTIDVTYIQFSGVIQPFLCFQGALQDLLLVFNTFSRKIPESLRKCKNGNRI